MISVVVRIPEILANREKIENCAATISRRARGAPGRKYGLVRHPRWTGYRTDRVHWTATRRISFDSVGSPVCRPVVQERVQVWSIEINTKPRAHHKISIFLGLVGNSQPRREVLVPWRIHMVNTSALEYQSPLAGDKDGQVL